MSDGASLTGLDRRDFVRAAGAGAAGVGAGCLGDGGGGGGDTLQIGYIPITDGAPLLVGHAQGFFEEEGLESETTLYRGWSDLAEAFQAGEVDVAHFLFPMTYWMRYSLDYPASLLAWDHTNGSAITVQPDVESWDDLRGETFAVPFWYSTHNVILQKVLRAKGIEPVIHEEPGEDQIKLIVMKPPEMPAALGKESIEGYIVAEPFNALGELNTGGKVLRFTGDIWKTHADCVVTMDERQVQSDPDRAQSIVNGVVKSQKWIENNRGEAATVLSNEGSGQLPYDREVIQRSLSHYGPEAYPDAIHHPEWEEERVGFYPYPYPSYTEAIYEETIPAVVEGDSSFLEEQSASTVESELVNEELVRNALESVGGSTAFGVPEEDAYEREETVDI